MASASEQLEAQRAYFASDDYIREEVAPWRDTTPAQRLAEAARMCEVGAHFWSRLDAPARERVRAAEALPADTIELLERLHATR